MPCTPMISLPRESSRKAQSLSAHVCAVCSVAVVPLTAVTLIESTDWVPADFAV